VSFAAITLFVASQRVLIVVLVYFIIDSVRKLLDTLSYSVCHKSVIFRGSTTTQSFRILHKFCSHL
jgi:uncharacterized membrane protein